MIRRIVLLERCVSRYIDGQDRTQSVLFPERLDDWVEEDNPVRVVDVFIDALDLAQLGFERAQPAETGRPAYHPAHAAQDLRLRVPEPHRRPVAGSSARHSATSSWSGSRVG